MRTIEKLTDYKFLNINQVNDPDNNVKGYQFAERRGTDSIAFICCDSLGLRFLVNREYKPPVNLFINGAFGGSLDKNGASLVDIVLDEVLEEAGYSVDKERVEYLGKSFVSTQMNQFCHLFIVFVNQSDFNGRKPENKIEEMAQPLWVTAKEIIEGDDWKAITILAKAQAAGFIPLIRDI